MRAQAVRSMPLPAVFALEVEPRAAQGQYSEEDRDEIHREGPVASGEAPAVQVEQNPLHRYPRFEQLRVLVALGRGKIRWSGPGDAVGRRGLPGQRIAALERSRCGLEHELPLV